MFSSICSENIIVIENKCTKEGKIIFIPQAKHIHTHKNKRLKVPPQEHLVYSTLKANLD